MGPPIQASQATLSEADLQACRNAAGWLVYKNHEDTFANAAYQLGIERGMAERAKYEMICDRCHLRQDSKLGPAEVPF